MPDMLTISNTSPLLYLNLIGQLELLPALYGTIMVPTAVQQELLAGQKRGVLVPNLDDLLWMSIVSLRNRTLIPLVTDLGAGEAEVIGLGLEYPHSRLILDDNLGRRIARFHKLNCTGTVGVLLKAKLAGLVPTIHPLLVQLQSIGMWLGQDLIEEILQQAGE